MNITRNVLTTGKPTDNAYTTMNLTGNVTDLPEDCEETIPVYWGYLSVVIAVTCFALMYTPVKKYETGDGMFFQWIQCSAASIVGIAMQLILGEPTFYPLAMVGGMFWVSGNMCVVPIFKTVGMSVGFCIWGLSNMIFGWATGRFGLFGLNAETPDNEAMNYAGVAVAVLSAIIFLTIKAELHITQNEVTENNTEITLTTLNATEKICIDKPNECMSFLERLSVVKKRITGISLCLLSGVLYSQTFTPGIYIQEHYPNASKNSLDYVFATFCGVYLTSTFYFLLYTIIKRSKPVLYPRIVFPGMLSGFMWAVATGSWFITNKSLSEPVAFTILSSLPPAIGALIGAFVFREITSTSNRIKLAFGLFTAILSTILSALSKKAKQSC